MINAISAADIVFIKFNVWLVTKPLGVFSSETKWLNASLRSTKEVSAEERGAGASEYPLPPSQILLQPVEQSFPFWGCKNCLRIFNPYLAFSKLKMTAIYCWFSHEVTKFQTSELLILLKFYFHDVLEQLKTNIQTNFHSEWVLGLAIDYAWISKLLRDVTFTWRTRELWCWFKRWLISGNSAIWTVLVLE